MDVCGIDFSTKAIDVVRLSIDSDEATWRCLELDAGKGDALERCRLIRGVMPARGTWKDEGVLGVALERPAGASRIGVAQLMRVQGAILACLPRGLLVTELHPAEWKQR
jgi:hypothetical protein